MRHIKLTFLILIVALLMIVPLGHAQDETESTWCVSVWYPSSDDPDGFQSVINNADIIQMVNPFWYSPRADGTIYPSDANAESPELLAEMRDLGLTIMPSIFSSISAMLMDEDTRNFHIDEIVALVERMDYDGIDIDYEGFPAVTRDPFSIFIEDLADALHERGYLLSIAVHAKASDEGAWESAYAQDWTRIAPVVDVFTIMTYDYTNRNEPPGPIAPTDWVQEVLTYAESVTDLSKVRMGLHYYGYSWQRGTPPATTVSWANTQRYIDSFDLEIQRDPANMELFVDLRVTGLPRQTIYLADAIGLAYKLEHISEAFPGLGGVSIWGIGGEDPANWDVLRNYTGDVCIIDATLD